MNLDKDIISWIIGTFKYKSNNEEYEILTKFFKPKSRKHWTNEFGEKLVKYLLEKQNIAVIEQPKLENFKLDLETPYGYYEIKTRNYTTNGTAGEKILGTPYKYSNTTRKKPIYIVCVGFQEKEADIKFNLFNPTKNKKNIIDLYNSMNIHYIRCSDLLYKTLYQLMLNELNEVIISSSFSKL